MSTIPTTRPRSKHPEVISISSRPWAGGKFIFIVRFTGNRHVAVDAEVLDSPARFRRAVMHQLGIVFDVNREVRLPASASPIKVAKKWRKKVGEILRMEERLAQIESEWRERKALASTS